jgi:hypothetical protein
MDNVQEEEEEVQQEGEARDWEYKSNRQTEERSCPLLLLSKIQELIENRCNDDDDDDYHQASTQSAVFNLSTTIVGAGIMALPATIKVLGLPLGLVAILLAGILSENSIQALLRYSRPCNATSYGALMANAFGEAGRIVLQLCIIINNFGSLIVYVIIIGLQFFFLIVFLSSSIQVSLFVFCNLIFCITLDYLIFDGFLIPQYLCTPFFFSCFGFVLKDSLEIWVFSDPFGWFFTPPCDSTYYFCSVQAYTLHVFFPFPHVSELVILSFHWEIMVLWS